MERARDSTDEDSRTVTGATGRCMEPKPGLCSGNSRSVQGCACTTSGSSPEDGGKKNVKTHNIICIQTMSTHTPDMWVTVVNIVSRTLNVQRKCVMGLTFISLVLAKFINDRFSHHLFSHVFVKLHVSRS